MTNITITNTPSAFIIVNFYLIKHEYQQYKYSPL